MAERELLQQACVIDQLQRHARVAPERIAFIFVREDGREESLSNAELAARVDALALMLVREAVPGERALLLYPPGPGLRHRLLRVAARRPGGGAGAAAAPSWRR